MQPESGGRFDARLLDHDEKVARFQVDLATADGRWSNRANVTAHDGQVEVGAWSGVGEPPPWLYQYLHAALRSAWRQHSSEGWPRRVTRWRDQPNPRRPEVGADKVDADLGSARE